MKKTLEPLHEWLETWVLAAKNVFVYDEKGFREQRALGRFSIVGGGYPVALDDGTVAGGIGCSGGTPEQDMDCARAGIEFWNARLSS